ncbi:class I SAM-dependent methyltransferase [Metapseudomonas otitidis]|uniref:class I SAM-dependent methyltransferase n=1 Tax=Metapseudomonas otitidis TaxID=319939 RepID=UPI0013F5F358|nr:methyltransferase [Pseudomonas otitidis]
MLNRQIKYIKQYIQSPGEFGTVCPASKWLCQEMLSNINFDNVNIIAELGSADGVFTKKILSKVSKKTKLDAYEINEKFASDLCFIAKSNDNLSVFLSSAELLKNRYDLIFSCLPFLSLPIKIRLKIINNIYDNLNVNGSFILYQYTRNIERILSEKFTFSRKLVLRNIPPAYVYVCKKNKFLNKNYASAE